MNGTHYPAVCEEPSQGSPSRGRSRKSRHRRNNSRGNNPFAVSSPVKSPTKEALHDELTSKTAALHHKDGTHVSPSSLKTLSRENVTSLMCQECERRNLDDSDDNPQHLCPHHRRMPLRETTKNLNDVCFGCDGGCSDATCSSKRSSRVSADIESNNCTPCTSPSVGLDSSCELGRDLRPHALRGQGKGHIEDDSTNMNIQEKTETIENVEKDPENGNSQSDSPKREQSRSPKSPRSRGNKRCKRTRSGEGPDEQPNKVANIRNNRAESEKEGAGEPSMSWRPHNHQSLDSCSEDAEVEESEDDTK